MNDQQRAVVTVIGRDMVGILAKTATAIAESNGNVLEVNQSVMDEFFTMVMLIDVTGLTCTIDDLQSGIKAVLPDMEIHVMHENIFDSMHRI